MRRTTTWTVICWATSCACGLDTGGHGTSAEDGRTEDRADRADRADAEPDTPSDGDGATDDDGPADVPEDLRPDAADGYDVEPEETSDVPAPDDAGEVDDGAEEIDAGPWLDGWHRRVALTLDPADIDEPLGVFPLLVALGDAAGRFDDDLGFVFAELPTDAERKKLAITTADAVTPCPVEIERWDAAARRAWLWVRVPEVSADAETVLYLYFDVTRPDNDDAVGDPGAPAAQQVWNADYRLVLHMQDDPDNASARDSTTNGNHGTRGAAGTPHEVAEGQIGRALRWDGVSTDEFIQVADAASLDLGAQFTAELWVNFEQARPPDDYERMLSKKSAWTDPNGWEFSLETGYDRNLTVRGSSGAGTAGIADIVASWAAGGWHHIVVLYDRATASAFADGAYRDDVTITSVVDNGRPLMVGRYGASSIDRWFGLLDEIRLSAVLRSPAWIRATYESGRDDLIDYGEEELRP